ncbi:glycosyltransferase family 39 protein [Flavisphingomonas formosensis]|uniref:glycosyltransferase family 39 protein n=1 Tax=Flavisphingomonas formosensis TaxID=861534 RepID=UPI001E2A304A|nr:glycosyltransferase family 39 protein [Sphingomonas formosensis]
MEYRPITESRIRERRALPGAIALLFLAAGLFRLLGTLHKPYWLDEAYSAYAADHGWAFLWSVVPRYETHPPFYYSLLHAWNLVWGNSLLASRAMSAFCGLMTLPALACAARELVRYLNVDRQRGWRIVTVALLIAALSPPLIAMSREVRPYPVMILVYAISIWGLIRLAREARDGGPLRTSSLTLFFGGEALMLWLHNLGPLYGFSLSLALLVQLLGQPIGRRDWLRTIAAQIVTGLVYLPGFLILVDQAPTWIHSTWLRLEPSALPWQICYLYHAGSPIGALFAIGLGLGGCVALARAPSGVRLAAGLLIAALLPTILSLAITLTVSPVFIVRTMTPAAVPAILIFAAGFAIRRWFWTAAALVAAMAMQQLIYDVDQLRRPPDQNWYGTIRWLQPQWHAGDELWAYPNEGALPFGYAARDLGFKVVPRSVPTVVPTLVPIEGAWHPTGSRGVVSLPRAKLHAIATTPQAEAVPTIWLLRLGAGTYDPGDVLLNELLARRQMVSRWTSGPIDIIGLRRRDVTLPTVPPAVPKNPKPSDASSP